MSSPSLALTIYPAALNTRSIIAYVAGMQMQWCFKSNWYSHAVSHQITLGSNQFKPVFFSSSSMQMSSLGRGPVAAAMWSWCQRLSLVYYCNCSCSCRGENWFGRKS